MNAGGARATRRAPSVRRRARAGRKRSGHFPNACTRIRRPRRHACGRQACARERRQVGEPLAFAQRREMRGRRRVAIGVGARGRRRRLRTSACRSRDRSTRPRRAARPPSRAMRRLEHARREPAPTRVRDGEHAAGAIGEQHGQAIGGAHGEHDAGRARDGRIRAAAARRAAPPRCPPPTVTTSRPCTCDSQTGSEGRNARRRRRFSPIAPASSSAVGRAVPTSIVAAAPTLAPPCRVVKSAATVPGPGQCGTIQSSAAASRRRRSASLMAPPSPRARPRAAPRSRRAGGAPTPSPRAVSRMHETEPLRMQRLPRETRARRRAAAGRPTRAPAVGRIAHQRMADRA